MKPQQIQRYEATGYMGASLARLVEISVRLGSRVRERLRELSKPVGQFLYGVVQTILFGANYHTKR